MAPKKKSKKKPVKTKKLAAKSTTTPKPAAKKKIIKKVAKKVAVRKPAPKPAPKKIAAKAAAPKKVAVKAAVPKKRSAPKKRAPRGKTENMASVALESADLGPNSGGQSGDLQGLSSDAGADSESVDELIEEGNSLEAEIVKGVEDADDPDVSEVRTHEVPEDDVPEEYLDKDA
jgi:hypothetical protein